MPERAGPIRGTIDGFEAPGTLLGWVCREDGRGGFRSDLRLQLRRGPELLLETVPTGPRPDVTGDPDVPVAYRIDISTATDTSALLDGTVSLVATDGTGDFLALEFYGPTLDEVRRTRPAGMVPPPARLDAAPPAVIVFLGAGSTVFAKNLLGDILLEPALGNSVVRLYDIDPERLRVSEVVARRIVDTLGVPAVIEATTDLGRALDGADFAVNMIQVGGYRPGTVTDFEVPNRFGLRQTIGDTLGIGGIMRALRTIPVLLTMAAEMERRCPQVLHLNYTNPMAMNCWALHRAAPRIRTIGLCHSIQTTIAELSADIGVPVERMTYQVAGINHMAFFLRLESEGRDLYPLVREVSASGRVPEHNRVRYDVLDRFGAFVTESSEHFAEYVPWYIKQSRKELVGRFNIPLDEYPRRCEQQIIDWVEQGRALQDPSRPIEVHRSAEYGGRIINAIRTGEPVVVYGNVPNDRLIDNLPGDCCVEVPCLVDANGLQPTRIGRLPVQLAALMQTNVNVQALAVEAALTGRRDHVYQAAMLDPHTAAELDLDQIHQLVDELLAAHRRWLPDGLYA